MVFVFCIVRPTLDMYPNADPQGKKSQVTDGAAEPAVRVDRKPSGFAARSESVR
jgi:hypothetical protein